MNFKKLTVFNFKVFHEKKIRFYIYDFFLMVERKSTSNLRFYSETYTISGFINPFVSHQKVPFAC